MARGSSTTESLKIRKKNMTNIDDKKQTVLDALDELFGDIGVPKKVTLDALEEIQSETESKIDALKADIEHDVS
jgi:hypothetical protein